MEQADFEPFNEGDNYLQNDFTADEMSQIDSILAEDSISNVVYNSQNQQHNQLNMNQQPHKNVDQPAPQVQVVDDGLTPLERKAMRAANKGNADMVLQILESGNASPTLVNKVNCHCFSRPRTDFHSSTWLP